MSIWKNVKKPKLPAVYSLGLEVNSNNATVTLRSDDNVSTYTGNLSSPGHYIINIRDGKHGQGANLTVESLGFNSYTGRVLLDPPSRELPAVNLLPSYDGPIRVEDNRFYNSKGRWRYKSVTAFRLYERLLRGDDINLFFKWATDIGANTVRIFNGWDPFFYPQQFPTYFDDFTILCGIAKKWNCYIESTIFASARKVFPLGINEQLDFFNKFIEATKSETNIIYELVNENAINVNQIDISQFALPMNKVCSRGSTAAELEPVTPRAQYGGFHNGRDDEWPRRLKNASEFRGLIICGETTRPDQDRLVNEKQSVQNFLDAGMCAGLFVDGINAHSNNLKDAQQPGGIESDACRAIITGFDRIPIGIREWEYRRSGPDALPPAVNCTALRVFEKRNGDEAYGVTIQRSDEMRLESSWEFVERKDNFYHIKRN